MAQFEIFRTSVKTESQADEIISFLSIRLGHARINFDLEDIDNILRIEGHAIDPLLIKKLLKEKDIYCELLE